MITDQDIKKLGEVFATKDDVRDIMKSAIFPIQSQFVVLDNRLVSVEQEIKGLREAVQTLSVKKC